MPLSLHCMHPTPSLYVEARFNRKDLTDSGAKFEITSVPIYWSFSSEFLSGGKRSFCRSFLHTLCYLLVDIHTGLAGGLPLYTDVHGFLLTNLHTNCATKIIPVKALFAWINKLICLEA